MSAPSHGRQGGGPDAPCTPPRWRCSTGSAPVKARRWRSACSRLWRRSCWSSMPTAPCSTPRSARPCPPRAVAPNRRPYETKDGHIAALIYNDKHWSAFVERVQPVWNGIEFATLEQRAKRIDTVYGLVAQTLKERTADEWLQLFRELEIPAAAVSTRTPCSTTNTSRLSDCSRPSRTEAGTMRIPGVPTWFSRTPRPWCTDPRRNWVPMPVCGAGRASGAASALRSVCSIWMVLLPRCSNLPRDAAAQRSCYVSRHRVTVLHQDIGDTLRGLGGDTSASRLRRWLSMNPSILVSAWRSPSGPTTRLAARSQRSAPSTAYHETRSTSYVNEPRKTGRLRFSNLGHADRSRALRR